MLFIIVVDVDCGSSYDDPSNPPIPFVVDRPFHFKIMKKIGNNDGVVIFSGNFCVETKIDKI